MKLRSQPQVFPLPIHSSKLSMCKVERKGTHITGGKTHKVLCPNGGPQGQAVVFSCFRLRRVPRGQEKMVQTELQAYCSFMGL